MPQSDGNCQGHNRKAMSRLALPQPLYRLFWRLKNDGPVDVAARLMRLVSARFRNGKRGRSNRPPVDDVLNLQAGEWVEVKSEEEILASLDDGGALKRLKFMHMMRGYCGRRFRVFKRVNTIYLEESGQRRKVRNTVLLEGCICDGTGVNCDRSCFFFWREAWLKRVDGPAEPPTV